MSPLVSVTLADPLAANRPPMAGAGPSASSDLRGVQAHSCYADLVGFRFHHPTAKSSLIHNHDSVVIMLNVRSFIRRLIPDEPFFVDRETRYSGPIPRATKYWCITALALNAAVSVVATVVMRNLAPILIACLASLFPAYMLLFWRDLVSSYNSGASKRDALAFPLAMFPALSLEWIGICLAQATSTASIVATVVASFSLPH